ncbi:MAG: WecB/TagA/CpsF family glycosyltransferase [Candidatus Hinthialibacter antarcticus]|nr:WecB/TagA/CpsF family glycosyltransferase [Candidatus Hinthialibacter antarcticus]
MNQNDESNQTINLFDVTIQNVSLNQAVRQIIQQTGVSGLTPVCFMNAHCVNIAANNHEYRSVLQQAPLVYADGVGMQIAARWMKTPLVDNVNGTDLFPQFCEALQETNLKLFLLGGAHGVADELKYNLERQYPKINVVGVHDGFFDENETPQVIETIRNAKTDILLVAMGVPKQENWITTHAAKTGARVAVGVGGLFNFYSGRIPRAPKWMRACGLEWLHRMTQEPGRLWKRYLIGNAAFLLRVFIHARNKNGASN